MNKPFPISSAAEFWNSMVKGCAPIQMMKKSIMSARDQTSVRGAPARGRPWLYGASAPTAHAQPVEPHSENTGEALWRGKEKLALAWLEEALPTLKGPLTSDAWLGMGVGVMTTNTVESLFAIAFVNTLRT
ncbi:MAG: hypothetical protein PHP57_02270 [Sideroxydans sp.]|nr:hypothetical protein [Sideroxydans sp.]